MALFLSRANRRPVTSPYRIHRLISQSSSLSTVSPGNGNTSSSAAADAADSQTDQNPFASYLSHVKDSLWKYQHRSPNWPFDSLVSLESLRTTINADNAKGGWTSPWSSKGINVDAFSARTKGFEIYPYVDLRGCLRKLGLDYKSLMPSQSTPDYALHPPKDEFVERFFLTFNSPKKETELDSARVEATLRSKWKELQVPEKIIRNIDDNHVIHFRDEQTETSYFMEIGETELWPEAVVDFLLDTMIEEMKNGVSFTSPSSRCPRWMGWENIKNALNDKFNKAYTKQHLYNKYCVLRKKYRDLNLLLLHKGMSYNASTGQVTAEERVWSWAARAQGKTVKQFREKGCPEYPKLCSLFEDTSATGAYAKTFMHTLSDDGHEDKVNDVQQNEVKDEILVDSANVKKVSKTAEAKMKCKLTTPVRKKPETEISRDSDDTKEVSNVREVSKAAEGKMKCKLTTPVRKKPETEISRDSDDAKEVSKTAEGKMKCKVTAHARKKSETVESLLDCMALLQDMEIKDVEFTKALDILRTTIDFRQCFLRMNDKRRLGWVRNLNIVKRD